MRATAGARPGRRPEVAEHLAAEFADEVPVSAVEEAVRMARRELRGQVPPGAMEEMVHRLAGHRLADRCRC